MNSAGANETLATSGPVLESADDARQGTVCGDYFSVANLNEAAP
jgi:hypothetical protein